MMPPDELLAMYRLAATWPAHGDIVELGAWAGLTTSYLATACRVRGHGNVYAVDTFHGTKEGATTYPSIQRYGGSTLAAFTEQQKRAGVDDVVRPLIGDTRDVGARYAGRPIRMLLIDADHSYDGVRGDYQSWLPHVADDGLIVFHDYKMGDVARFVDMDLAGDQRVRQDPGMILPNVYAVTRIRTSLDVQCSVLQDPAQRTRQPVTV